MKRHAKAFEPGTKNKKKMLLVWFSKAKLNIKGKFFKVEWFSKAQLKIKGKFFQVELLYIIEIIDLIKLDPQHPG